MQEELLVFQHPSTGRVALSYAVEKGHLETVSFLLEHCKAEPNSRDWQGKTSCMVAAEIGKLDVLK